jgi:hypothetical protein
VPLICRLSNAKIYMYAGDHRPPHFHLNGKGWNAIIDLATLKLIAGKAERGALNEAIVWASISANAATLWNAWSRLNERG